MSKHNKATSQNHSHETIPPMKLRMNRLLFPQIYFSSKKQWSLEHNGFASKRDQ